MSLIGLSQGITRSISFKNREQRRALRLKYAREKGMLLMHGSKNICFLRQLYRVQSRFTGVFQRLLC